MKKNLSIAIIATSVLGLGSLSSCQDSEVENIEQVAFQRGYESSFVKTFGNVDPNQTWDFTSYARHQRVINQNLTRDMTSYETIADGRGWYYVEDATLDWMLNYLPEATDNRKQVTANVLRTEDKEMTFEIVPLYQGRASLLWKLGIFYVYEDGSTDDKVYWDKGQDLQYSNLTNPSHTDDTQWTDVGATGNTLEAVHVRSKPIEITVPAYTTMNFYLEITDIEGNPNLGEQVGNRQWSSSTPPQIGVVPCPLPSNVPAKYKSFIVGCEDVKILGGHCDKDYNDVVFLMTGYVPEVIYNEKPRITYIRKRYMIEDLGDTYDYDFNDIVVDVTQETTQTWVINTETHEATPKEGETPDVKQWATVRWLQGTLPIQVKVGDTYFGQVTDPTADVADIQRQLNRDGDDLGGPTCPGYYVSPGRDPLVIKPIVGNTWNPQTNNVTCFVWKAATPTSSPESTEGVWTSVFPGRGAIPYMIAVDPDTQWMGEGDHIPTDWMEGGDMVMP